MYVGSNVESGTDRHLDITFIQKKLIIDCMGTG